MPCVHYFGIIDALDKSMAYDNSYEPEKYNCVAIDDDALNGWYEKLPAMKSCFHSCGRPETALARCGVTLIPPESLALFYEIVSTLTPAEFAEQAAAVLSVIDKARRDGKFVIHYGV